jgi:hypothetical protein
LIDSFIGLLVAATGSGVLPALAEPSSSTSFVYLPSASADRAGLFLGAFTRSRVRTRALISGSARDSR